MERVFGRPQGLTELPFHYCPGCTHGIIHRLIGEVLEELDIVGDTIGVAPVGCAGFSLDFFSCDFDFFTSLRVATNASSTPHFENRARMIYASPCAFVSTICQASASPARSGTSVSPSA